MKPKTLDTIIKLAIIDAERRVAVAEERATKLTEENEQLATAAKALLADVDKAEKALGGCQMKPNGKRETFVELAERVAGEIIEGIVDSLVGVKITPAQKDDYVAFAKENLTRFGAVVKHLPDLLPAQRAAYERSVEMGALQAKAIEAERRVADRVIGERDRAVRVEIVGRRPKRRGAKPAA